jgi:hypothetical protein
MDILSVTGYNRRPPHLVAEYKGFFRPRKSRSEISRDYLRAGS